MPRPSTLDYPPFYDTYVRLVPEQDLKAALETSLKELESDLARIPADKGGYAYGEGKWTVNGVVRHATDTERVFAYRALCIARGERQPLPGFDENAYAEAAKSDTRGLPESIEEMLTVRRSTVMLFKGFSPEALASKGVVDGRPVTVLAIGYMIIGHWRHHASVLRGRYGIL